MGPLCVVVVPDQSGSSSGQVPCDSREPGSELTLDVYLLSKLKMRHIEEMSELNHLSLFLAKISQKLRRRMKAF